MKRILALTLCVSLDVIAHESSPLKVTGSYSNSQCLKENDSFKEVTYSDPYVLTQPDLRLILYCNPTVRPNENAETTIEFFTSDQSGKFEVIVHGVIGERFGEASFTFEVGPGDIK